MRDISIDTVLLALVVIQLQRAMPYLRTLPEFCRLVADLLGIAPARKPSPREPLPNVIELGARERAAAAAKVDK